MALGSTTSANVLSGSPGTNRYNQSGRLPPPDNFDYVQKVAAHPGASWHNCPNGPSGDHRQIHSLVVRFLRNSVSDVLQRANSIAILKPKTRAVKQRSRMKISTLPADGYTLVPAFHHVSFCLREMRFVSPSHRHPRRSHLRPSHFLDFRSHP